jgi:arsenate reductase-like glutaredoxin family protein
LPLGKASETDIGKFLKEVQARKFSDGLQKNMVRRFLQDTMTMVRLGDGLSGYTKSVSLYDLKQISDRFFEIANGLYEDDNGHAVKTAAALASFQISQAILMDMRGYCQDVEVYLPFTGEKQKVLGLKAASFWLSRSMNYIKTYSYEPAEIFIQELKALQERGLTAAAIAKDERLRTKMQNAFMLLTKTMNFDAGPFNRAYVDFNKLASTFKDIQSLGPQQQDLLAMLKAANTEEQEFIRAFGAMTRQLNRTNTNKIDVGSVVEKMTALKTKQSSIPQRLRESLRLLSLDPSEDQGQVINQVVDLLNHQMNIFTTPINVPYFESVRAAFYNANVKDFRAASEGCFQLDGVNP